MRVRNRKCRRLRKLNAKVNNVEERVFYSAGDNRSARVEEHIEGSTRAAINLLYAGGGYSTNKTPRQTSVSPDLGTA